MAISFQPQFPQNPLPEGFPIEDSEPYRPEGAPLEERVDEVAVGILGQDEPIEGAPVPTSSLPSAPPRELLEEEPRRTRKPPTYEGLTSARLKELTPPKNLEASSSSDPLFWVGLLILVAAFFTPPPFCFILLAVGASLMAIGPISEPFKAAASQQIPLRYQWNENNGYCGECSLIASGMCYGQWLSQFDVRAIAAKDPSDPHPNAQTDCQFLLGDNDQYTASQVRLNSTAWSRPKNADTKQYLTWVKQMVAKGYPVSIGVFTNENLFYGDKNPNAGQKDYDHIVTVTKIDSKDPDGEYNDDDVIYFDDHALWNPTGNPQYVFSYTFKEFQKTRQEANDPNGPIYSLNCTPKYGNYGIAIQGVIDPNKETVPVRVDTSVNYEKPEIVDQSNERPASMPLELTVTLSDLTPGVKYTLYKYDDEQNVPTSDFNAHSSQACKIWDITPAGTTCSLKDAIQSNKKAIYRAVLSSGP